LQSTSDTDNHKPVSSHKNAALMDYVDAHTHRLPASGTLAVVNLHRGALVVPADGLWSSGIHPWFIREGCIDEEVERLRVHLALPGVVALGECGLDRLAKIPLTVQQEVFCRQLELASAFRKAVIIHNVRSGSDLLHIRKGLRDSTPWLIHGFQGSIREAELFVQQGCWLGFGRMVLKNDSRAARACEVIPLEHILPETDNATIPVSEVIRSIASLRKISFEVAVSALYDNFVRFFGLHHYG